MHARGTSTRTSTSTSTSTRKENQRDPHRPQRHDGLELMRAGADRMLRQLLLQVLTEREEKNSVAIASNESFGGRTGTFSDPRPCMRFPGRFECLGHRLRLCEAPTESDGATRL